MREKRDEMGMLESNMKNYDQTLSLYNAQAPH